MPTFAPSPKPKLPPKPPVRKPPARKGEWVSKAFGWFFIAAATALIVLIVMKSPSKKRLVCQRSAYSSLTGFGTCRSE